MRCLSMIIHRFNGKQECFPRDVTGHISPCCQISILIALQQHSDLLYTKLHTHLSSISVHQFGAIVFISVLVLFIGNIVMIILPYYRRSCVVNSPTMHHFLFPRGRMISWRIAMRSDKVVTVVQPSSCWQPYLEL